MKPIIIWTYKQRLTSTIWWSVGVAAYILLELSFYPTFHKQSQQLSQLFDQMPAAAKSFLGSSDFTSPVGYLNGRTFYLLLPLLLCILTIGVANNIAREEQDGTLELLLARPIARVNLLIGKALAGIAVLLTVAGASFVTTAIICKIVDLEVSVDKLFLATVGTVLFCLSVGAFSFMLASMGRFARGASIGLATIYALGGYILVSLTDQIHWLKVPARIFPFYYYRSGDILYGTYNWTLSLFMVSCIVVFSLVSWLAFRGRDIAS